MKPLSQPTTLVDVFPCTRGCVPDSLFSFSLSLSISLSRCLFVFFSLSFLLSAFLLVRKNGRRRGAKGVQSPGQISSTARECEWRDVFAKTLCMYRFSKVRCNYSASSRVQRETLTRIEGKERRRRPTRRRARGRGRLELCRGLLCARQTYEEVF